jgi:hypothetical protein
MSLTRRPVTDHFGFKILIHEEELSHLAAWVRASPDREVGGDLFGFWTSGGAPAVHCVLGPGPQARGNATSFYQDNGYMVASLRQAQAMHGLQQLGEWHSHHRLGLAEPSHGDVATIRRVFDVYPSVSRFVLCIANLRQAAARAERARDTAAFWLKGGSGDEVAEVGAFLFRRDSPKVLRGAWVVLPGSSPLGESLREQRAIQGASAPSRAWSVARTTLDTPDSSGESAPEGWWTPVAGTDFIRDFDALMRTRFEACRLSLRSGRLHYGFSARSVHVELIFPSAFPHGEVVLQRAGDAGGVILAISCPDEIATSGEDALAVGAPRLAAYVEDVIDRPANWARWYFLECFRAACADAVGAACSVLYEAADVVCVLGDPSRLGAVVFRPTFPAEPAVLRLPATGGAETTLPLLTAQPISLPFSASAIRAEVDLLVEALLYSLAEAPARSGSTAVRR